MKTIAEAATVLLAMFVFLFAFWVGPLVLLWSINTLAEEANVKFYIPHNIWTYLACFGIFLTLKGSSVFSKE